MQITDLEGAVTRVICPEYDEVDGGCRLKKSAREGGPLSQLLERVAEDAVDTRNAACVMFAT